MKWQVALLGLAMGGWLVAAASCSNSVATEWCDGRCECEGCSDRALDECIIDMTAAIEVAEAYGCEGERADYDDCRQRQAECNDNDWEVNGCSDYDDRLDTCIALASDIIDNPGPGGNTQCVCTCNCATCSQPWNQACPSGTGCESCDVGCPAVCAASTCGAYVDNVGTCF